MLKKACFFAGIFLILVSVQAMASPPKLINFQGRLTTVNGTPETGSHDIQFNIYSASGGSALWTETDTCSLDSIGAFSVLLGSVNPLNIDFSQPLSIEVVWNGNTFIPMQQLASVPYAFYAITAESVVGGGGGGITQEVDTLNSVTSRGAVTANDIQVGNTRVSGNLTVEGNLKVTGTIEGGSPVKIKGGLTMADGVLTIGSVTIDALSGIIYGNGAGLTGVSGGGITQEADTLNSVTSRGAVTAHNIQVGCLTATGTVTAGNIIGQTIRTSSFDADSEDNEDAVPTMPIHAQSVAMGSGTTASGHASTAMGYQTTASSSYTTAMGYQTTANGLNGSIAMGYRSSASGQTSTAMGLGTGAGGNNSTAMGLDTGAGGDNSVAMGNGTIASGNSSTAMGLGTQATNLSCTAMGYASSANGVGSTTMGNSTRAIGNWSTAIGATTEADPFASLVIGQYNVLGGNGSSWIAADPLFIVGNGVSAGSRSNALTVYKNGSLEVGSAIRVAGGPWTTTLGGGGITQEVDTLNSVLARGNRSTREAIIGKLTVNGLTTIDAAGNIYGQVISALGGGEHVPSVPTAGGNHSSVAMGDGTTASGWISTAMGWDTIASGGAATAMGNSTNASGADSTTMGDGTGASGKHTVAMGNDTNAQSYASLVIGQYNVVSGTQTSWVSTEPVFVIGNGDLDHGGPASNALTVLKNAKTSIGTLDANSMLTVLGTIETQGTGGIKFPDNTIQITAATGGGGGGISTEEADTRYIMNTWEAAQAANFHITGSGSMDGSLTLWNVDGRVIKTNGGLQYSEGGPPTSVNPPLKPSGAQAVAMGGETTATGAMSTAMGYRSTADGFCSVAMGEYTQALAMNSTAMGMATTAGVSFSTAMGQDTYAKGVRSTTMGLYTTAAGDSSIAIGSHTTTDSNSSLVMGSYNAPSSGLFVVGNGSDGAPSNAFVVYQSGSVEVAGMIKIAGGSPATGEVLTAMDSSGLATWQVAGGGGGVGTLDQVLAAGNVSTFDAQVGNLTVEGNLKVTGTIEGGSPVKIKGGMNIADGVLQVGNGVSIDALSGIIYGNGAGLTGVSGGGGGGISTAEADTRYIMNTTEAQTTNLNLNGDLTVNNIIGQAIKTNGGDVAPSTPTGTQAVAMGSNSVASGNYSFAMGGGTEWLSYPTVASGLSSIAMGANASAGGKLSIAIGAKAYAGSDYSVAIGTVGSWDRGNGPMAQGQGSVAIGNRVDQYVYAPIAIGQYSLAMLTDSHADGNFSAAIGNSVNARADYSVVLGRDNVAGGTPGGGWVPTEPLFVIGNGTGYHDSPNPSNALTILKNGWMAVGSSTTDEVDATLEVRGLIMITGGSPATGEVLTAVDDTGLATWQVAGGGGGGISTDEADTRYIMNTFEAAQAADFNITGNGVVGGNLTVEGNLRVLGTIEGASPVKFKGGISIMDGVLQVGTVSIDAATGTITGLSLSGSDISGGSPDFSYLTVDGDLTADGDIYLNEGGGSTLVSGKLTAKDDVSIYGVLSFKPHSGADFTGATVTGLGSVSVGYADSAGYADEAAYADSVDSSTSGLDDEIGSYLDSTGVTASQVAGGNPEFTNLTVSGGQLDVSGATGVVGLDSTINAVVNGNQNVIDGESAYQNLIGGTPDFAGIQVDGTAMLQGGIDVSGGDTTFDADNSVYVYGPLEAGSLNVYGDVQLNSNYDPGDPYSNNTYVYGGLEADHDVAIHGNLDMADDSGTASITDLNDGVVKINGDLDVSGNLTKASGSFMIDDPLDPKNKVLRHSFVESPDMKNIYDGVAVLDATGEAVVALPEYFEALNRDFRYQLTCVGGYAPVYVKDEVKDNKFTIAGGKPGLKVSWTVTGIRQDAYAVKHPIVVREEKGTGTSAKYTKGQYIHPDAYGAPGQ